MRTDAKIIARYADLEKELQAQSDYEPVCVTHIAPVNRQSRFVYLHEIQLPFTVEILSYNQGGNLVTLTWCWKVPTEAADRDADKSMKTVESLKANCHEHHTRAMRRMFVQRYGLLAKVSPTILSEMYRELTGDHSRLPTADTNAVADRLRLALDAQDPELVYDLRGNCNNGRPEKYQQFWDGAKAFLNEQSLNAADSRRHGAVTHMAAAISVRDFVEQVRKRLPGDTPIPSVEWVRLQFWPSNAYNKVAENYSGRLDVKHMVQSRHLHHSHPDAHYAAAAFRHLREFAVDYAKYATLVSLDDKHLVKVGEPGFPVAAVDRGRMVVVGKDVQFQVADHDFTKLKITPSVALLCDIPDTIEESFYRGTVYVGLKNTAFAPSSPLRHGAELKHVLKAGGVNTVLKPILLLYTDGGPDHRVTYVSVQASLICLFRSLNLDYLVAMRTAPMQSYCNPVERIMSLINLAFQSVGVMRAEMTPEPEDRLKKANSMAEVRQVAEAADVRAALQASMDAPIALLEERISRLQLKDEPFKVFPPASDADIDELWQEMHTIDPTLSRSDTTQQLIKSKDKFNAFIDHCCVKRHYFFAIKKCGADDCELCAPPTLPREVFESLHQFPDPTKMTGSDSFKPFREVWGKATNEDARPSTASVPQQDRQREGNVALKSETARQTISCSECQKPRCVYANKRLDASQSVAVACGTEDVLFVCGSPLLPADHALAADVVVRSSLTCSADVERAYFSAKKAFSPVCYVCGINAPAATPADVARQYQSIHMPCAACAALGKKPRTRGPSCAAATAPSSKKRKHQ